MPRINRNTVDFEVDGLLLRAEFKHQHAEEHDWREPLPVYKDTYREAELVEEVTGGTLGSQSVTRRKVMIVERVVVRTDYDYAVKTPIIEETEVDGRKAETKLRHVTTCVLQTTADGKEWSVVGEGKSRCSTKDKYNWRFGIKESLTAAIRAAGIEKEGPVLGAFYTELPKRPAVEESVEGDVIVIT